MFGDGDFDFKLRIFHMNIILGKKMNTKVVGKNNFLLIEYFMLTVLV